MNTITTVRELKEAINNLNDDDQVCIETVDENNDVEDLYPFYIDTIDNIKLANGNTIKIKSHDKSIF